MRFDEEKLSRILIKGKEFKRSQMLSPSDVLLLTVGERQVLDSGVESGVRYAGSHYFAKVDTPFGKIFVDTLGREDAGSKFVVNNL